LESFKTKTKARVKHVAFNLIQLYAKKEMTKGFRFAPDSYLQTNWKVRLYMKIHRTKLNQLRSKADMESDRPMDRLVLVMWVW
jgi:transcription-repair coupling factor (superfamily II helicase)